MSFYGASNFFRRQRAGAPAVAGKALKGLLSVAVLATGLVWNGGQAAQAGWTVVFQDEFNGTSLDREKWWTRYIYQDGKLDHLPKEKERYRDGDAQHVVKNGNLSLIATKTNTADKQYPYESGMIRSKQTFMYGYFEARIKLPSGKGLWPTFWLNPDFDKNGRLWWPPEIDICEYVVNGTTDLPNMMNSSIKTSKDTRAQGGELLYANPKFSSRWNHFNTAEDLSKEWHTCGLVWEKDKVTTFLDGVAMFQRRYKWVQGEGGVPGPAHIIFNLAIGGPWAGKNGIDDSKMPAAFQIDYIRVCQFSSNGGSDDKACKGAHAPLE